MTVTFENYVHRSIFNPAASGDDTTTWTTFPGAVRDPISGRLNLTCIWSKGPSAKPPSNTNRASQIGGGTSLRYRAPDKVYTAIGLTKVDSQGRKTGWFDFRNSQPPGSNDHWDRDVRSMQLQRDSNGDYGVTLFDDSLNILKDPDGNANRYQDPVYPQTTTVRTNSKWRGTAPTGHILMPLSASNQADYQYVHPATGKLIRLRRWNMEDDNYHPGSSGNCELHESVDGGAWTVINAGLWSDVTVKQFSRIYEYPIKQDNGMPILVFTGQDWQQKPRANRNFAKPVIAISLDGGHTISNALILPSNWGVSGDARNTNCATRIAPNEAAIVFVPTADPNEFDIEESWRSSAIIPWDGTSQRDSDQQGSAFSNAFVRVRLIKTAGQWKWTWPTTVTANNGPVRMFPNALSQTGSAGAWTQKGYPTHPETIKVRVGGSLGPQRVTFFGLIGIDSYIGQFDNQIMAWEFDVVSDSPTEHDVVLFVVRKDPSSAGADGVAWGFWYSLDYGKNYSRILPTNGTMAADHTNVKPYYARGGITLIAPGPGDVTPPDSPVVSTHPRLINANQTVTATAPASEPSATVRYTSSTNGVKPALPTSGSTTFPGGGLTLSAEVDNWLLIAAFDAAGNRSGVIERRIQIDKTAPGQPTPSPAAGSYVDGQTVNMSLPSGAGLIRFTSAPGATVPSDPNSASAVLPSGGVVVPASTTLKFRAYDDAGNASAVVTAAYTITGPPADTTPPPDPTTITAGGTYTAPKVVQYVQSEADASNYWTIASGTDIPPDPYDQTSRAVHPSAFLWTGDQTFAQPGTFTVKWQSVDLAGNGTTVFQRTYIIEGDTGPVTPTTLTGPFYPTTAVDVTHVGTLAVTNPGNSLADDASYATIVNIGVPSGSAEVSHAIKSGGYTIAGLPDSSKIVGAKISGRWYRVGSQAGKLAGIQAVNGAGVAVASNAVATAVGMGTSEAAYQVTMAQANFEDGAGQSVLSGADVKDPDGGFLTWFSNAGTDITINVEQAGIIDEITYEPSTVTYTLEQLIEALQGDLDAANANLDLMRSL